MNEQKAKRGKLGRWFRLGGLLLALVLVWQLVVPSIVSAIAFRAEQKKAQAEAAAAAEKSAEDYYDLATVAIALEEYDIALDYLDSALQTVSEDDTELHLQLWLTMASVSILTGDWDTAAAALDQALEADPEDSQALLLRAQLFIETGDNAAAIADVLHYLDGQPEDTDTRRTIAQLMELTEDYDGAAAQYAILYSQTPEDESFRLNELRCLFLSERYTQAIEGFDDYILRLEDGEDPYGGIAHFLRGACLTQLGEYAEAVESFEAAIEAGYDEAACLEQSILCRFDQGDYAYVAQTGERLTELDTSMVAAPEQMWQRVGIAEVYQADYEGALASLERAQAVDPELEGNAYYRGICLLSLNRLDEAAEAFTQSIEQGFLLQFCYYNRGVCYVNLQDYESALADMNRTLESGDDEELTQAALAIQSELEEYFLLQNP